MSCSSLATERTDHNNSNRWALVWLAGSSPPPLSLRACCSSLTAATFDELRERAAEKERDRDRVLFKQLNMRKYVYRSHSFVSRLLLEASWMWRGWQCRCRCAAEKVSSYMSLQVVGKEEARLKDWLHANVPTCCRPQLVGAQLEHLPAASSAD